MSKSEFFMCLYRFRFIVNGTIRDGTINQIYLHIYISLKFCSIYHGIFAASLTLLPAWCKSVTRTLGPWDPGAPSKFKSGTPGPPSEFKNGTPGPPSKFKSGTSSPFFNEIHFSQNISSLFLLIYLCLF